MENLHTEQDLHQKFKLKPIYCYLSVLLSILFVSIYFEFLELNMELVVALLAVIPSFVIINRFKRYSLVIIHKDGRVFTKKIPLDLKRDTVEVINEVNRKCLH